MMMTKERAGLVSVGSTVNFEMTDPVLKLKPRAIGQKGKPDDRWTLSVFPIVWYAILLAIVVMVILGGALLLPLMP
jgi:hypothetical protein